MADLDAVNLGLDENEADIAEELQDFGDSFDTRSEASVESSSSSATNPSISSVSSADSSMKSKNRRARLKRERSVNGANMGGGETKGVEKGSGNVNTGGNKNKRNTNNKKNSDSDNDDNDNKNGEKSPSPKVKKTKLNSNPTNHAKHNSKSYDYMTKLNYLFRDTRFFLIKSNNSDNVALSKNRNVWSTLPQNEANLNKAYKECRNVLLIFSVNESGKYKKEYTFL